MVAVVSEQCLTSLLLMSGMAIKHYFCDFVLNFDGWMYRDKYMHPGGLVHAIVHSAGSLSVMLMFSDIDPIQSFQISSFDGVVHYHIDYVKVRVENHFGWVQSKSRPWRLWLGADQTLHALCGVAVVFVALTYGSARLPLWMAR